MPGFGSAPGFLLVGQQGRWCSSRPCACVDIPVSSRGTDEGGRCGLSAARPAGPSRPEEKEEATSWQASWVCLLCFFSDIFIFVVVKKTRKGKEKIGAVLTKLFMGKNFRWLHRLVAQGHQFL